MFDFNPDRIAYLEAAGWRAYYDRAWLRLLRLTVNICQEQFAIPFPQSLLAAYYVTRGAVAWAPVEHDEDEVRRWYVRFYRLARRYSGLKFDPLRAGRLEVQYWIDHRRLIGNDDKSPFIDSMTALHAELFDLPPEKVRESAELRVEANNTVDLITSHRSTDEEADWARLEDQLRRCYRSIFLALNGKSFTPASA
jgi:hypothetical protein